LPGEFVEDDEPDTAEPELPVPDVPEAALPLELGVTSNRVEDEFWLEPLDVLEEPSSGCAPGVVVSPGVVEPTPGEVVLPPDDPLEPLELEPDWPEAGPPEASLPLEPWFRPLDWPVELLLVSEPFRALEAELPDWLVAGAPSSRWEVMPGLDCPVVGGAALVLCPLLCPCA